MVGLSAALTLLNEGLSVLLVERGQAPPQRPLDVGLRVSAINPASRAWLQGLGAWDCCALRAQAYTRMQIWESEPEEKLEFSAAELGEARLGDIVPNALLRSALWSRMVDHPALDARFGCSVEQISHGKACVRVGFSDGSKARGSLLLGTDGTRSVVRGLLGIETRVFDYQQTAMVAHLQLESPAGKIARQRFLPTGPLGMLPLQDDFMSCVWSTTADRAEALQSMEENEFIGRFERASQQQCGMVKSVVARACFPLRRQDALSYGSNRCVLLGDAAHGVHPMAGLGVNLGFADVALLGEAIAGARAAGRDLASPVLLRRYVRQRRSEAIVMSRGIHALQRCFMSRSPLLGQMRRFGMQLLDGMPGAKRALFLRARGDHDRPHNSGVAG